MKKLIVGLASFALVGSGFAAADCVHVSGYYRKNGTYVRGHTRGCGSTSTPSYSAPSYTPAYTPSYTPSKAYPSYTPRRRTYSSCTEAKAAGISNIPIGSLAYQAELDRDNDGIACESGGGDEMSAATRVNSGNSGGDTTSPIDLRKKYFHQATEGIHYFAAEALKDAGGTNIKIGKEGYLLYHLGGHSLLVTPNNMNVHVDSRLRFIGGLPIIDGQEIYLPIQTLRAMGCTIQSEKPILLAQCEDDIEVTTSKTF